MSILSFETLIFEDISLIITTSVMKNYMPAAEMFRKVNRFISARVSKAIINVVTASVQSRSGRGDVHAAYAAGTAQTSGCRGPTATMIGAVLLKLIVQFLLCSRKPFLEAPRPQRAGDDRLRHQPRRRGRKHLVGLNARTRSYPEEKTTQETG